MSTTLANPGSKQKQIFKLKGNLFTLTIMQLVADNLSQFKQQLESVVQQTPHFFRHAPIVLDIVSITDQTNFDPAAYQKLMHQHGIILLGIRGNSEQLKDQLLQLGLASFTHNADPATTKKTNTAESKSKLITQNIRSGQQIYAQGGDLIILGSVSHGAEILADGNIHVYGALRGRVLAGIMGDTTARIFCKSLDPELISIAGRYLVSENIQHNQESQLIQIYLDGEHLKIDNL